MLRSCTALYACFSTKHIRYFNPKRNMATKVEISCSTTRSRCELKHVFGQSPYSEARNVLPDYLRNIRGLSRFDSVTSSMDVDSAIQDLLRQLEQKNSNENEFIQAVKEECTSLRPLFVIEPKLLSVFRMLTEPERSIIFRVPWVNRHGIQCFNVGYRVQYSSSLGPYKGGLRFHPSVTLGMMKFLGFEQTFKNALTGLAMGGAKGGSDFDPREKTETEIMNFCQSFMTELYKHVGPMTDVPAGDINVGSREIGYLFGHYKRLTNRFDGALTAKGLTWGGSHIRPEATGYGCVIFANEWCKDHNVSLEGARCLLSGAGNVALHAGAKLIAMKAKPLTFSDSDGCIYEPDGFTSDQLQKLMHIKFILKGRVKDYCQVNVVSNTVRYFPNTRSWSVPTQATLSFPCAVQNELCAEDVPSLLKAGCQVVVEGANMPTTPDAISLLNQHGIALCPAKAANAGGVAVSGLEMAQNASRTTWSAQQVENQLDKIMKNIYENCKATAIAYTNDPNNLLAGANICGFTKVATALIDQGSV